MDVDLSLAKTEKDALEAVDQLFKALRRLQQGRDDLSSVQGREREAQNKVKRQEQAVSVARVRVRELCGLEICAEFVARGLAVFPVYAGGISVQLSTSLAYHRRVVS